MELFNDSIYRLKGNHYEVEYLWAKGDWRFTYEDGSQIFSPLRKGCLRIYTMAETNNYLYIVFYRQGGDLICFYDKKLKKDGVLSGLPMTYIILISDSYGTGITI